MSESGEFVGREREKCFLEDFLSCSNTMDSLDNVTFLLKEKYVRLSDQKEKSRNGVYGSSNYVKIANNHQQ